MTVPFQPLSIPKSAGIGLRSPHIAEMIVRRPSAGWLEVHAENYMGDSAQVAALETLRETYPLSIHGVGLSLGSAGGVDREHLARLSGVCDRFQPDLVSEHLAWCVADGAYVNDLLPLRYDDEALAIVSGNVGRVQDSLKRPILIENLSAYLAFSGSTMSEADFLAELSSRTGCGLLLDVNNVHVSASNLGFDAEAYIDALPANAIGEIHLAGHAVTELGNDTVLIDDHGSRVPPCVWTLYARTLRRIGARPTLIEWDSDLPSLDVLLGEAMWADLLAGSIAFSEASAARAHLGRPTRSDALVIPFDRTFSPNRMPVLAAFEAIRPAITTPTHRGTRHAAA